MNERHNEIADIVADMMPGVYSIVYESGKKGIEFTEEAFEKFTELIIVECIGVIRKEKEFGKDRHDDYNLALYEAYKEIQEHFGLDK